ncbi:MAG: alanine--tRNA ligase [bacterium]
MKTSYEIRSEFIDFFLKRGHSFIRSAPLFIPEDPTLLFTNAGMNQFKSYFLNLVEPVTKRAVNSQRCIRVSGKHNDLEEVGISPHHHTLFEMLGNWSFGDYYKKEAIQWAWELLTGVWSLPREKLWITVFRDEKGEIPEDVDAYRYWKNMPGVDQDKIRFFGRKDNFWEMGETGPCGPCTEIHMDRGPSFCDKHDVPEHVCRVNGDCRRIVELWNLVFIQYNRIDENTLEDLPKHHVDTGMGLERITAVLQNAPSNYETDLFLPIMDELQNLAGQTDEQRKQTITAYRVIADHIRAASFLLADGVMPSNEWRGYVLRRIIRRAVRFGTKIGFDKPFLYRIADAFIRIMAPVYSELSDNSTHVSSMLKSEEQRFFKTLEQGLPRVTEVIESARKSGLTMIPGEEIFKLYDTYGFPVDIAKEIVSEAGMKFDITGFEDAMNSQRNRARNAWKKDSEISEQGFWTRLHDKLGSITFTGYDTINDSGNILAIVDSEELVNSASHSEKEFFFIVDPTPFYAEAGGQVGDTGVLETSSSRIKVLDTVMMNSGFPVLKGRVLQGDVRVGDTVTGSVHASNRKATARNHTATHLLHHALRLILGEHVKQAGSLVSPERMRFDFTHFASITPDVLGEIERGVNDAILADLPVMTEIMALDEAVASGVIALFGEKYDESVRVVRVPGVSAELCGGTHVTRTGEIGLFKILSESGISAGVRRIEAVTGYESLRKFNEWVTIVDNVATTLKAPPDALIDKIEKMQKRLRELMRENEHVKEGVIKRELESKLDSPKIIGGVKTVIHSVTGLQVNQLRDLADLIKQRLGSCIVLLGSVVDDRVFFIAAVTPDLTRTVHAGKLVEKIAKLAGGGGGGKPDMAQAGSSQPERLDGAFEQAESIIASLLSGG